MNSTLTREAAFELVPAFVTDRLDADQHAQMLALEQTDNVIAREIALERELVGALRAAPATEAPATDILNQLRPEQVETPRRLFDFDWFRLGGGIAVAAGTVFAFLVLLAEPETVTAPDAYRTLSDTSDAATPAESWRLIATTPEAVTALGEHYGFVVIAGPDSLGSVLVRFEDGGEAAAIARMQEDARVRLLEPRP